jgi:hypothetical protein
VIESSHTVTELRPGIFQIRGRNGSSHSYVIKGQYMNVMIDSGSDQNFPVAHDRSHQASLAHDDTHQKERGVTERCAKPYFGDQSRRRATTRHSRCGFCRNYLASRQSHGASQSHRGNRAWRMFSAFSLGAGAGIFQSRQQSDRQREGSGLTSAGTESLRCPRQESFRSPLEDN